MQILTVVFVLAGAVVGAVKPTGSKNKAFVKPACNLVGTAGHHDVSKGLETLSNIVYEGVTGENPTGSESVAVMKRTDSKGISALSNGVAADSSTLTHDATPQGTSSTQPPAVNGLTVQSTHTYTPLPVNITDIHNYLPHFGPARGGVPVAIWLTMAFLVYQFFDGIDDFWDMIGHADRALVFVLQILLLPIAYVYETRFADMGQRAPASWRLFYSCLLSVFALGFVSISVGSVWLKILIAIFVTGFIQMEFHRFHRQ